jgi:isopentenyl-diphosphate delta-isomerase
VGDATDWKLPIIATGGIRNGLDVAKALALGASCAGMAHTLLEPATKNREATILEIDSIVKEIRATMFLVGADSISKMADIGVDLWT